MKRITLCALFLTLFLLISCNTSGKNLTDDEVAKSDGTVIDLAKITKNITDTVAFAKDVKEIHSLVKSIDTLAKAIGKKIVAGGATGTVSNKNASLVAGAYNVIVAVETKLGELEKKVGLSSDLKGKVTAAMAAGTKFLTTLKGATNEIGQDETTDENAKKAIDISDATGDKGAKDLIALNTSVNELLTDAEAAVTSAIKELASPVKPSN
ncbi:Vsp/OspC family lipoprotein [Borrelia puertoricensis]|uniref:Vsp/OspC family lipoprotein n=1 Tax=Borrelia puertoricensis TaxID=2756107 RepID=UPI00322153A0